MIRAMATERLLHGETSSVADRLELRHDAPASDDREALAPVLDGVEEVGEASCSLGGGDLCHMDQII
jgi:hypothetical protein